MRRLRLPSSRPHLRAMPRASQRRAPLRRLWLPISQSARVANGALPGSAWARAVSVLETSGNQGGVERHVPAAHHNATPRLHTYAALVTAELQISSPSDLTRIATARAHASNNAPAQARPSKPVVAPMPMAWAASSPPSFARTRPRPRRRSPPTSLARAVKGPRAQQRVSAGMRIHGAPDVGWCKSPRPLGANHLATPRPLGAHAHPHALARVALGHVEICTSPHTNGT